MAKLIGSEDQASNWGERLFLEKAMAYLEDDHIIYWNRVVFGREFDVCILIPEVGVLVVELKGWREENILRVENSDTIIISTEEGEVAARPQKQARGYRFAIERRIRQGAGLFPPVFSMVCLPQVSRAFYQAHRLDVVSEESFTILAEDLSSRAAFYEKINRAIACIAHWARTPFDKEAMLKVRGLFEADLELDPDGGEIPQEPADPPPLYRQYYSVFYYIGERVAEAADPIRELAEYYRNGCKVYAVFAEEAALAAAVEAIDGVLDRKKLVRDREDLALALEPGAAHYPRREEVGDSFTAFHCSFHLLRPSEEPPDIPRFFSVFDGEEGEKQLPWMGLLGDRSAFNLEQYRVEHADRDRHIVIRAGAGTGKTHVMINRIGYLCYRQNIPIQQMADRLVMITFTNEAANQMEEKLKGYFRNCYLLSGKADYLLMTTRIDHMQISTIHAYAKNLMSRLGTEFGYGTQLSITSGKYSRRRKVSDVLDRYVRDQRKRQGPDYLARLGMPIYALRDTVLEFIEKLHSKSVDISDLRAEDFGDPSSDHHDELHALLAAVIPQAEREYARELREENKVHLKAIISLLSRFVKEPCNRDRIRELVKGKPQFLFVDEFQDTDDIQIETLLTLAGLLEYRLFLVGDIKQCIYRFRGATENAFDQLGIEHDPGSWLEFSLRRNYRTDTALLELFDRSFQAWGARRDKLLTYHPNRDRLVGVRQYNADLKSRPEKFYHPIPVTNESQRIPALLEEIRRLERRLAYDEDRGVKLSGKEKSIAILVRENWQAEVIRAQAADAGITVHTNTGGDLYQSAPALDMLTLVNALLHFDEANYLYPLVTSNFFALEVPKAALFEMRENIRKNGWRAKVDERPQTKYLIDLMNRLLVSNPREEYNTWERIIRSIRLKPALQAIREIYQTLRPWLNFSDDPWKQQYYRLNVDLLFEQVIGAFHVDKVTVNTLQESLHNSIVSGQSVDSRVPPTDEGTVPVQCVTVHKAKGLEYGHVILPYCSAPMDEFRPDQLQVSVLTAGGRPQIGYSMALENERAPFVSANYNPETEQAEKSREEARILYVAMTRAIRSFSWIIVGQRDQLTWQSLIERRNPPHGL